MSSIQDSLFSTCIKKNSNNFLCDPLGLEKAIQTKMLSLPVAVFDWIDRNSNKVADCAAKHCLSNKLHFNWVTVVPPGISCKSLFNTALAL